MTFECEICKYMTACSSHFRRHLTTSAHVKKCSNKNTCHKCLKAFLNKAGDVVVIDCYCCGKHMRLNSSEVHRCHNIPKSKGGDWSKNNVYLCCAGCNQDMGNEKSVLEYKIDLYVM